MFLRGRILFYIFNLAAILLTATDSYAQKEKSIENLDLDNLSEDDCRFLDSCLIFDSSIPKEKRISYYTAMQLSHEERNNYLLALYCTDSLVQLYHQSALKNELAQAYAEKSMYHDYLGQYPQALRSSQKGLELFVEVGDLEGEASSYNDIGVIHYYTGNQEKARLYFEKSLDLYQSLQDTAGIAMYYNNVANTFFEDAELPKALSMYEKGLEFDIILNDKEGICITKSNIGETYTAMGEYDKAESTLLETLILAEELDDPWILTNPLRGLGDLYQQTGELHKAILVLERNVKICEEIDALPEQIENYNLLYTLHKKNKNHAFALHYLELHKSLSDSLFNMNKERMMNEMEVQYELNEKAQQIDLIKKEKEINELEHAQKLGDERNKQYYLLFGLFAFAIVILFAVREIQQKKRANQQLTEQNEIIQNKNQELQSAYLQIEEKKNEIIDSIRYAKRIQTAILPQRSSFEAALPDSFVLYKPKDVVAGDFYWLEEKNGKILFAAADCTGHGVPGAMVSVVCNNGLNRSVREHNLTDPGKILDQTREIVIQEFGKSDEQVNDGMDIALCSIEPIQADGAKKYKIQYAGAHNPLWILRKGQSEIEEIKADKQPIGQFRVYSPYKTHTLEAEAGDTLYLFSDGYADQFGGEKGKKMKSVNFKKLLLLLKDKTMIEQHARLDTTFEEWKGHLEQLDDVCVIGVRL